MKFTAAATATVLASSITASAESLPNPAGGSLSNAANDASHRSLAVAMKGQDDIHGILKERRSLKKTNNVIRNLQDKLKRRKLRNQATQDGSTSNAELDLGLFSRDLQLEQNITEAEEEEQLSVVDSIIGYCSTYDYCTCSNIDADAYTGNIVCSYEEECYAGVTVCNDTAKVCYTKTYEFNLTAPQTGSMQKCYSMSAPLEFSYCFGKEYFRATGAPDKCFLEIDGTECNSCEFTYTNGGYCMAYDCSNADADYVSTECTGLKFFQKKAYYSSEPCETTPVTATDETPVEGTIEGISSEGTDKSSSESESAGARFGSDGFAIVAIVASIFSWTMM